MRIYFVRHGQTDWNLEMRAQGRKDVPLNAVGREQAEKLRESLKDLEFDAVYTLPLRRAAETAEIAVGDRYEINYDERLVERSFGDFEGRVLESWVQPVEGLNIDDITLDGIPGKVETVKSIVARARDFVEFLKQEYPDEVRILVVGHGAMSKAFDWVLAEHDENDAFGMRHLENGEVKEYVA